MTNKEMKMLSVTIPCYVDRFLSTLSRNTGMDRNDIAIFFLCQKACYAQSRHTVKKPETKTISPYNAVQPE